MFDGSISETKVSLAGARNRRSETRAEFLRRQAREREDRERKRVRDISATKIQASWRRFRCRREQRNSQRELFDKRLGDLQKVEGLLPDVQRATFVFNALQKFLLRPFTFFFSGPEDAARLDTLLRLVCSSGQQPAATNIFASLLAEEEQQRQSILAQSRALLRALLQLEQNREALRLLLMIRDVIYDRASNAPVHPSRSPAAVGFLLRGTQVLQALPEQLPLDEESQAAAVDLVRLACVGMEASAEKPRRHLLLTLLSAPSLPELVDLMEQPRSFFECLQRQLPESCEDTEVLHEEVNGLKRLEWLAGNMGLLFSHLVPEPRILSWLAWTKAKLPLDFWTGHEKAVQRQRLWNAALARQLAGVEGSMLDDVLSFYFQVPASVADEPVDVSEDAVQEMAFKTNLIERLRPTGDVMRRLGDFTTPATLRLQAFALIFKFRLHGTFDAELDDPAGWWARLDAPQLLPYLNRVVVALLREEPDRRNLPLQGKALRRSLLLLLRSLCDRQRRKALAPGTWWLAPELRSLLQEGRLAELSAHVSGALGAEGAEAAEGAAGATGSGVRGDRELLETVLAEAPQMLPFEDRVALLHAFILADQADREETRADWARASQPHHRIRRDYLMEDGFAAFERLATTAELRALFVVEFVAADGSLESGIDGGGLFKEFMIYVCRTAFSPEYGLFTVNSDNRMYPFPGAFALHHDAEKLFRFLGKVVGKAIYEMMLLEPQFSRAFLNRVLHRESDIEDVASVDRDLHKGMWQTRQHPSVEELGLSFTTAVALPSGITEVELLPGGAKMEVTKENLDRYLQLLTLHRTSLQMDRQSAALRDGMECVLHPSWIQMFDARELSILISGSSTGFNVADLREHTVYAGGYTERSQVIQWLWELLESMDPEDMGRFLMFSTSCSRPPLLGFKSFDPKFCIHKVHDAARLPTASTCANLLKLPEYPSMSVLKEKVLQAIRSESGFDLS